MKDFNSPFKLEHFGYVGPDPSPPPPLLDPPKDPPKCQKLVPLKVSIQMSLKLAVAVRETVAQHRLDALEEGGGGYLPLPMHPWGRGGGRAPWWGLGHWL